MPAAASTTKRRWSKGSRSGQIGGVALDVYRAEPCTDSPLFGMPGVLCTPHLGASTEEAQTQVAVEAVELLIDFFTTGDDPARRSTWPPLDPKTLDESARLSRRGLPAGPAAGPSARAGPSVSAACTIRGEVAGKDTNLLSVAFAAGFLQDALDEEVNIVNAEVLLARTRHRLGRRRVDRTMMGAFGRRSRRGSRPTGRATWPRARCSAKRCRGWWPSMHTASKPISTVAC